MSAPPARLGELSALKLALMAKKVRAEAEAVLRADPIAIVGLAARAPGAESASALWALLREGRDAIRDVPKERWNAEEMFDSNPSAPGKASTRSGGFLEQVDGFDAAYFGILPREAERMDPQQRLLLEVALEALDDAGQTQERLRGSRSGVFIASYHDDYTQLQYADLESVDARTLTGTLHSVLANRLSYFLDLRGPSLAVDSACSSSLVAVHLACQSLRTGESDLAVAGGVSLMLTPTMMVSMSKVGFMAPDGRCKTFDARADGFGRGEGSGVVVLKRLSDAIADDDRIWAVIRGSAVNQDGHSTLLAAPNGVAQRALILEALATGQVDAGRIGFVEAHGTGTALGDPIEVEALAETIGKPSAGASRCYLGSAKANLGHLEAAAGVTGLIKAVLALEHGAIPPQPNFTKLNPHISLANTRLAVADALVPWPRGASPRLAAVSSFGVGGTNAHVIVEEKPNLPARMAAAGTGPARLLPLSAKTPRALQALAEAWRGFVASAPDPLDDLVHTAARRRTHYERRWAVVGASKEALASRLGERLEQSERESVPPAPRAPSGRPRIALVFSGQGPQWWAMGRELLESEAVFRGVVTECDRLLAPLSGWSLLAELTRSEQESRLDQTEVAQPALFALQVALAAQWKAWGVEPEAVVGHSAGELAALHVAGVLTLPEAVRVIWHRGHIMQGATGHGKMAQVALTGAQARDAVVAFGDRLSVAAMNGPRSVVLSGDPAALEQLLAQLAGQGVTHRMLPVNYAFHSAQMTPFRDRLIRTLGAVAAAPAELAVYSTVTGGKASDLVFDAAYFGRNVREPVRFEDAIAALGADGIDTFIEVGPHPVLSAAISECLDARSRAARVLPSLRRTRPERETLLESLAQLYEAGLDPRWAAVNPPASVASLPPYPWQRVRHWIATGFRAGRGTRSGHPLLGQRISVAGTDARVFESGAGAAAAWVADHRIFGRVVVPAAAVLETFHAAAHAVFGEPRALTGFAMHRPLFADEPSQSVWQTLVRTGETPAVELYASSDDGAWQLVASATLELSEAAPNAAASSATRALEPEAVYRRFSELGVEFGPAFQRLREVRRGEGSAEAFVDVPAELEPGHALHPVLLDAGLQLCSLAAPEGPRGELPAAVFLPLGADRVRIFGLAAGRLRARATLRQAGTSLSADVVFEALDGAALTRVAEISGMRFAPADPSAFAAVAGESDSGIAYRVAWHPETSSPEAPPLQRGSYLVVCDRSGFAERLSRALGAAGESVVRVVSGAYFERSASDAFFVNPAHAADCARVLEALGSVSLSGVIECSAFDAPLLGEATAGAAVIAPALHWMQALASSSAAKGPLVLVTRGARVASGCESGAALRPEGAGVWGLASVASLEHPELSVRCVDLDPEAELDALAAALVEKLRAPGSPRAALREGRWLTPKLEALRPSSSERDEAVSLSLVRPGSLDGVELRAASRAPLRAGEVRLRVEAAGINFRDVLLTLGMYPGAAPLGVECAGVVTEVAPDVTAFALGARVFGYAPGSLGSEVTVPAAFLAPVPGGLGPERAAALPVAFLTAYYGLHRLARLERGQSVLIHAAAGGVGLAAVQLARRAGAVIFGTAGSDAKRELLRSLGVDHALDSRSLSFVDGVRSATGGRGVDVVLNSLSGEFIEASLGVVAHGGAFLELGKRGVLSAEAAAKLRPDVRYFLYDLGAEAEADHALLRPMLDDIAGALERGELGPLPAKVYPLARISDAFRFMAQARHVGKLVVRPKWPAPGVGLVDGEATYLVTGGLGGLGLETARWLAKLGARSLVLVGRRAPSERARQVLAELEQSGVSVRAESADVADRAAMQALLGSIAASGRPLRGLVHAAGVTDDAPLVLQSPERARGVLSPKSGAAFLLHELTSELPLDFFVSYSAAGVQLGAPGQSTYAAANAELDALCEARKRLGLPALSVAWGAWGGVGMAAELAARGPDVWAARGLGKLTPEAAFPALEALLRDGATAHAVVLPIDWTKFLAELGPGADRSLFPAPRAAAPSAPRAVKEAPALLATLHATPPAQRRAALLSQLAERALHVVGLDRSTTLHPKVPLKDVGLDSLMAVELRNVLARATAAALPATLLFDYPTLDALADHLWRVLELDADARPKPPLPEAAAAPDARSHEIAELSDEEAEALLLKELESSERRTHGA